jgi:hypothetical protein
VLRLIGLEACQETGRRTGERVRWQSDGTTGAFTGGGFVTVTGGYQCNVQWTPTGGKPQDVTGLVTWSSSDTSIATVNSTGFVTAGTVAIRFSYKGSEGFMTLSVEVARQRQ